jgi:hypothetical protein
MEESVGVSSGNTVLGARTNFPGQVEMVKNQLTAQSRLLGTLKTMLFFDPRLSKSWSVYGRQW